MLLLRRRAAPSRKLLPLWGQRGGVNASVGSRFEFAYFSGSPQRKVPSDASVAPDRDQKDAREHERRAYELQRMDRLAENRGAESDREYGSERAD